MPCRICGCPEVRWLPVRAVARQFGCTPKLVRRMVQSGALEGVRLGRQWRVDHESLDDLIRRGSVRFSVPDEGQSP